MIAFTLEMCTFEDVGRPLTKEKYPACLEYVERLKAREA